MDCRHLSIERLAPPGHLADRRSGIGHGGTRSKAPSTASFAGTPRKNVRALASLARRRRPPLLARLPLQARPEHNCNSSLSIDTHGPAQTGTRRLLPLASILSLDST